MMQMEQAKTLGELRDLVARLLETWGEATAIGTVREHGEGEEFTPGAELHECYYCESTDEIVEIGSAEQHYLWKNGEGLASAFKII